MLQVQSVTSSESNLTQNICQKVKKRIGTFMKSVIYFIIIGS